MNEFLKLSIIIFIALILTTGLIWFAGTYFELTLKDSYQSAVILLFFVFGGIWNIVIFIRGEKNLTMPHRVCAGIRGIGMMLCGITIFLIMVIEAFGFSDGWYVLLLAAVLWIGSIVYEDRLEQIK